MALLSSLLWNYIESSVRVMIPVLAPDDAILGGYSRGAVGLKRDEIWPFLLVSFMQEALLYALWLGGGHWWQV